MATKETLFKDEQVVTVTIVERYCDRCMETKLFAALQHWYSEVAAPASMTAPH
jgi:hypothetical protein